MGAKMNAILSRSDFDNYLSQHGLQDHQLAVHLFDMFELPGSQTVTFQELVVGVTLMTLKSPLARVRFLMTITDEARKGVVYEHDLARTLSALERLLMPTLSVEAVEKRGAALAALVFTEADANDDGVLSPDELTRWLEEGSSTADLVSNLLAQIGGLGGDSYAATTERYLKAHNTLRQAHSSTSGNTSADEASDDDREILEKKGDVDYSAIAESETLREKEAEEDLNWYWWMTL